MLNESDELPPTGLVQLMFAVQEVPAENEPRPTVSPPTGLANLPKGQDSDPDILIVAAEQFDEDQLRYTDSPGHLVVDAKLLPRELTHKAIKKKTCTNRFI